MRDIADESVIGPAVPQARDHVIKLPCTPIALAVLDMHLKARVKRGVGIGSGDDIPAGAAAGDVTESVTSARGAKGVTVKNDSGPQ
jgi:hypothetical protein